MPYLREDSILKEFKYQKENAKKETSQECIVRDILKRNAIPFIGQKIVHHPGGFYLLDFLIRKPYRIALEIDGFQHLHSRVDYDVKRTLFLELEEGLKVVRFLNVLVNKSHTFEKDLLDTLENNKIIRRPLTIKEQIYFRRNEKRLRCASPWKERFALTIDPGTSP